MEALHLTAVSPDILSRELRRELGWDVERKTIGRGRPLVRVGDQPHHVWWVLSGALGVFLRKGSKQTLVEVCRWPALYGATEVLAQINHAFLAVALEPCEVVPIAAEKFWSLFRSNSTFAEQVALELGRRRQAALRQHMSAASYSATKRLARLLVDRARLQHAGAARRCSLDRSVTQVALAKHLSLSRRTLGRSLDRLRAAKLVERAHLNYVITDIDALEQLAGDVPSMIDD